MQHPPSINVDESVNYTKTMLQITNILIPHNIDIGEKEGVLINLSLSFLRDNLTSHVFQVCLQMFVTDFSQKINIFVKE